MAASANGSDGGVNQDSDGNPVLFVLPGAAELVAQLDQYQAPAGRVVERIEPERDLVLNFEVDIRIHGSPSVHTQRIWDRLRREVELMAPSGSSVRFMGAVHGEG